MTLQPIVSSEEWEAARQALRSSTRSPGWRAAPRFGLAFSWRSRLERVPDQTIYSEHAETYAAFCEHSAPNTHYDRPAILRLAGDVTGKT
jgi:hypothetical protein